jgi:hypothetical protein
MWGVTHALRKSKAKIEILRNFVVRIASNSDSKCKIIPTGFTCPNKSQATCPLVRTASLNKNSLTFIV